MTRHATTHRSAEGPGPAEPTDPHNTAPGQRREGTRSTFHCTIVLVKVAGTWLGYGGSTLQTGRGEGHI